MQPTTFNPKNIETQLQLYQQQQLQHQADQKQEDALKKSCVSNLFGYIQDALYIRKIKSVALVITTMFEPDYYRRLPYEPTSNHSYIALFSLNECVIKSSFAFEYCCPIKLIGTASVYDSEVIEYELQVMSSSEAAVKSGSNEVPLDFILLRGYLYYQDFQLRPLTLLKHQPMNVLRYGCETHTVTNSTFHKELVYTSRTKYYIIDTCAGISQCQYMNGRIAAISVENLRTNQNNPNELIYDVNLKIHEMFSSTTYIFPYPDATAITWNKNQSNPSIFIGLKNGTIQRLFLKSKSKITLKKQNHFPIITKLFKIFKHLIIVYSESNKSGIEIYNISNNKTDYLKNFKYGIDFAKLVGDTFIFSIQKTLHLINLKGGVSIDDRDKDLLPESYKPSNH